MDQEKKGGDGFRDAHAVPVRLPSRTVRHHRVQGEMDATVRLQNEAVRLLLATLAPGKEGSTSRVLENLPNTLASSGRALEVLLSANLLCHGHTLLRSHWPLVRLPQFVDHPRVASEILLAGDQDYRKAGAEMHNLRDPLLLYVVQRVGGVDGEADQDDMGVGVTERAEAIIVFLSSRIP